MKKRIDYKPMGRVQVVQMILNGKTKTIKPKKGYYNRRDKSWKKE